MTFGLGPVVHTPTVVANIAKTGSTPVQFRRNWTDCGRYEKEWPESSPILAKLDRTGPTLAKLDRNWCEHG